MRGHVPDPPHGRVVGRVVGHVVAYQVVRDEGGSGMIVETRRLPAAAHPAAARPLIFEITVRTVDVPDPWDDRAVVVERYPDRESALAGHLGAVAFVRLSLASTVRPPPAEVTDAHDPSPRS